VLFQRREHLCSLSPLDDILALHTIHYASEFMSRKELAPPKVKVSAEELDMAVSLIKAMQGHFEPDKYKDEYQSALREMVEAKLKGGKVAALATPKVEIGDLMAALRESIKAAKKEPVAMK